MSLTDITIRGAREHNLQDVSVTLPRNRLICMTGVSGSGKSSLAFDTLYAEGQRRYIESLSTYARQFLGQLPKPEVDAVTGLAPSISIQQKTSGRNPRSTVGTITEIYDYLRVLYARVGTSYCPNCQVPISAQSSEQIVDLLQQVPQGTRYQLLAPLVQQQKGEFRDFFEDLLKQGFLRARVDGEFVSLTDDLRLDRQMKHTIDVVIDRLAGGKTARNRIAEAVQNGLRVSGGQLLFVPDGDSEGDLKERLFSAKYSCPSCHTGFDPPSPQLFSFNSPLGMCPECTGLGRRHEFLAERIVANENKPLLKGALHLLGTSKAIGRWRRHLYQGIADAIEKDVGMKSGSFLKTAWGELPSEARKLFLYGLADRLITFSWRHSGGVWKHGDTYAGYIDELLESYRKTRNPMRRRQLEKYMEIVDCTACHGTRLNQQAQNVKLETLDKTFKQEHAERELSLPDVCRLSIREAAEFFYELKLNPTDFVIAEEALKEIRGRLGFLLRCGLDYLALDRTAPTLSGGETQRIRLASQIGSGLVGVVYILDEPSIGLHPRDNVLLLDSLCNLRDQGNTVVVVEHDEDTMRAADHIIDFGPGPGVRGGEVTVEGSLTKVKKAAKSLTGQYLSGKLKIEVPKERRPISENHLRIEGAGHNNLKGVDVEFPLGAFICITGVSGSGKSSLINDILWQILNRDLNKGKGEPGKFTSIAGLDLVDKAIDIDQSPIGRTPRSNPATYVKLFDQIRNLFANLPESRARGFKPGRFSFNVEAGRCSACEGYGATKLEMDFLADIWVTCPVCEGNRFQHDTLDIQFKGYNIAEILNMDVQEALELFENIPKIKQQLQTLHDVGLDYIKLGQPSPTLSGGEAQRVKLAKELSKRSTGKSVYILDEPTTGLHFADIHKLLEVLHGFVDAGNTVIVVEHNLDVIKTADWVIDLGPEGGRGGGEILFAGRPEELAQHPNSHTGRALAPLLGLKAKPAPTTSQIPPRLIPLGPVANGSTNGRSKKARKYEEAKEINIRGARQHNLQDLDLVLPRNSMSVFCGPSGSGKTSLAMDTLYAEGQRRYVESLSSYARQFLGQMPKPRVEHIHGLSPSIAIEQKNTGHTPRSTVGTVTEIYDYLRVLFTRLGTRYCPDCEIPIATQTHDQVVAQIMASADEGRILILAPQTVRVGQKYETLWERLKAQGYARVRVDGVTYRLDEVPEIDRRRQHTVEIVVDRVTLGKQSRTRLASSIETAFDLGGGELHVAHVEDDRDETEWEVDYYSLHLACHECGRSFEELTPQNFSFNSPLGWCEGCEGIGTEQGTDLTSLIADPKKTLAEGAIAAWPVPSRNPLFNSFLNGLSKSYRIPLDVPFEKLGAQQQRVVLYGGDRWIEVGTGKKPRLKIQYKGLYPAIEEAARVSYAHRKKLNDMIGEVPCSYCGGSRLRDDAAAVRFEEHTIQQICQMSLEESLQFLSGIKLKANDRKIAGDLLDEARSRLSFLVDVGLNYLNLERGLPTLSGGEAQRIRLAGQIGRALTGVLYVLDEPTIGLHPRDNTRLLEALQKLRDLGNTLIVVEHDREVMEAADQLVDFGPGAGRKGGEIVGRGTLKQLTKQKTLTGNYLSGREAIPIPKQRRVVEGEPHERGWIELLGVRHRNLRDVDLKIPIGTFTCITGVSGSGKSTLVEETLSRALQQQLTGNSENAGAFDELLGVGEINKVITVDQQPLGSTPASNPATYTGVFEHIRELFARLPDSRVRGYRPGRFSFNRAGGRCEDCEGNGQKCIEMHFLPDVWVECETCRGKRYNQETLDVKFNGYSIADVLAMPIGDAYELFGNIPKIRSYLGTLCSIGLDYLTLGQSAPTLSGGEAQRVKLASELVRPHSGKTLYILDEPTTGLHFDDIAKLLKVLNSLVEAGNTVVVIEHNLDVIKMADWLVDLGPEAGEAGGRIVVQGTPEAVVAYAGKYNSAASSNGRAKASTNGKPKSKKSKEPEQYRSYTGELLKPVLAAARRADLEVYDAKQESKKQAGDLDLRDIGKEEKTPWQTDGRRWHTQDRVSLAGKSCRWDGEALAEVVDYLHKKFAFAEPNWNHRSTVEMKAKSKENSWFLHAMTSDEWFLTLKFRVPKKTFDVDRLNRNLDLKSVDDMDDIPVYNRGERVRVKNLKGPWQEVQITILHKDDVTTDDFKSFLKDAAEAFLGSVNEQAKLDPNDLMPWKQLGRKWHLLRKGFPSNRRVNWPAELIDELCNLCEQDGDLEMDYSQKQVINITHKPSKKKVATIHTKRRQGVDVTLFDKAGEITLGRIAELGADREITETTAGGHKVKIRLDDMTQVRTPDFPKLLESFTKSLG